MLSHACIEEVLKARPTSAKCVWLARLAFKPKCCPYLVWSGTIQGSCLCEAHACVGNLHYTSLRIVKYPVYTWFACLAMFVKGRRKIWYIKQPVVASQLSLGTVSVYIQYKPHTISCLVATISVVSVLMYRYLLSRQYCIIMQYSYTIWVVCLHLLQFLCSKLKRPKGTVSSQMAIRHVQRDFCNC